MGSFIPSDLKERNRATVYSILRSGRELSKADLVRETGISAPTILKIIEYFESLGLISEAGEGPSPLPALGRRPRPLRFEPSAAYAIGAEYDGVHLSLGVVDLAGRVLRIERRKAPKDLRGLLGEALDPAVADLLASTPELARTGAAGNGGTGEGGGTAPRVVGLGLGLPGTVDESRRCLNFAPLVGASRPFDCGSLLDGLESRLGFPVVLENDANAAALGEYAARALGPSGDLLFAILGVGLGAGLILDGKLRKGPRAFAGEIGYLAFDPGWRASLGEPGWLEAKTGLGDFWAEASRPGGPSRASLERVAGHLALGLANLCTALDLERVVVGGAQREAFGSELTGLVREALARLSVLEVRCEAPVSEEPGVSGAAGLALDRWLGTVFAGQ